jgi:hypothetical protein
VKLENVCPGTLGLRLDHVIRLFSKNGNMSDVGGGRREDCSRLILVYPPRAWGEYDPDV